MAGYAGIPTDSLIVVCCHAIWLGGSSRGQNESEWLIESFQVGETLTFISHIRLGLDELAAHDGRVLVFSGGDTKRSKTNVSEATSYRNLALANNLFGHPALLSSRILTDDYATDSLQNVLFPVLAFASHAALYQKVKQPKDRNPMESHTFPKHLTIIGHEFKRRRFEELHVLAVRWPNDTTRFKYIGADPPMGAEKRNEVLQGELLRGYGAWQEDLYGAGEILANKRRARGWTTEKEKELETIVNRGWHDSVFKDDVLAFLRWDGGASRQEIYPGTLPWDAFGS